MCRPDHRDPEAEKVPWAAGAVSTTSVPSAVARRQCEGCEKKLQNSGRSFYLTTAIGESLGSVILTHGAWVRFRTLIAARNPLRRRALP